MVKAFGWSLRDIDETAIESMLPFLYRASKGKAPERVYADQVDWL